jgi:tripartite-type tricarboxylate transporter receptor subunit TctC
VKLVLVTLVCIALVAFAPAASALQAPTEETGAAVACTIGGFVGQVCRQVISDVNAVCDFLIGDYCLY